MDVCGIFRMLFGTDPIKAAEAHMAIIKRAASKLELQRQHAEVLKTAYVAALNDQYQCARQIFEAQKQHHGSQVEIGKLKHAQLTLTVDRLRTRLATANLDIHAVENTISADEHTITVTEATRLENDLTVVYDQLGVTRQAKRNDQLQPTADKQSAAVASMQANGVEKAENYNADVTTNSEASTQRINPDSELDRQLREIETAEEKARADKNERALAMRMPRLRNSVAVSASHRQWSSASTSTTDDDEYDAETRVVDRHGGGGGGRGADDNNQGATALLEDEYT